VQDPEVYLDSIGVTLACAVHRDRDARLDVDHRLRVGHDIYFFSSPEALAEFRERPLRYIDRLADPVSRQRFTPTRHSPVHIYEGRSYYFSNDQTRTAFLRDPAAFAEPQVLMR